MIDGLYLNLMVGPVIPAPVPREVVEALTSVKVTSAARGASGFELQFRLPPRSRLLTLLLLSGGSLPPVVRVVLFVTLRGKPEVLIDGVITNHQVSPGVGGEPSTLKIVGSDLTAVMGWVTFDGIPYPGVPPTGRVALMLAKYAAIGVIPAVIPSVLEEVQNPAEQFPHQKGTDLRYIEFLAHEAGYIFVIEPGPAPGTSVGYWGPEIKVGVPQPALNVDMDEYSNVESLSFRFNNETATQYYAWIHEPITKTPIPIPIPDVSLLNPPLGVIPPVRNRVDPLQTAKLNPIRAALCAVAQQAQSTDAVSGDGTLDVMRYGRVLRPRRLVGVRGAGEAFDGLYYVQNVTHNIRRGEYKQDFTLVRNGLVSTVPRVPV